jgi:hypothetical protein
MHKSCQKKDNPMKEKQMAALEELTPAECTWTPIQCPAEG